MEKTNQSEPRLAHLLHVKVGEEFLIDGFCDGCKSFTINEDGSFKTEPRMYPGSCQAILAAIENPELVVPLHKFTDDEKILIKLIKTYYPDVVALSASKNCVYPFAEDLDKYGWVESFPKIMFPSIEVGDTVLI